MLFRSRDARLGEDVEDNEAHLSLEAIYPGWCRTVASRRRVGARVCAPFLRERERWSEGERSKGERGEEGLGGGVLLILSWREPEASWSSGRACRAPGSLQPREEDDRASLQVSPSPFSLSFL